MHCACALLPHGRTCIVRHLVRREACWDVTCLFCALLVVGMLPFAYPGSAYRCPGPGHGAYGES